MTEQEAWSIALFIDSTCVLFGCQTEHYLSMYRSTFTDSHTLLIAKLFLYIPSLRIVLFTTLLYACINFYASLCKVVQYTLHIFIEWNFYEFYRNNIFLSLYIDIDCWMHRHPLYDRLNLCHFFFIVSEFVCSIPNLDSLSVLNKFLLDVQCCCLLIGNWLMVMQAVKLIVHCTSKTKNN